MSKIAIIGAGTMGTAFAFPCLDNNHDVSIIGTHLENDFINQIKNNDNQHPGLKVNIPKNINIYKNEELANLLPLKFEAIVIAVSSKGIEWVSDQLIKLSKNDYLPPIIVLTKGLSIYNNNYEVLVDKLERLLNQKNIKELNISAIGGPCLAAGLANKIHTSVVLANRNLEQAKIVLKLFTTSYYHISPSDDLIGVEVCAAIKNIFSIAVGASHGLCSENAPEIIRKNNHLNAAAALIKQSVKEMEFFVKNLKGKKETVLGLAGIGDLYVSADGGRNSKMGFYLGDGMTYSEAKKIKMNHTTVEGADLIFEIGKKVEKEFSDKEMPLMITTIKSILENKKLEIDWKKFN